MQYIYSLSLRYSAEERIGGDFGSVPSHRRDRCFPPAPVVVMAFGGGVDGVSLPVGGDGACVC